MSDLLAPSDESGIATAVAEAAEAREPLLVVGNGTKSGMLRPVQAARSLSTRNHAGITLYSPNELVISARAGTPLAEIEATLAERGQHIIAEPPDLSLVFGVAQPQTLGGVIATNLSGPRRVAWGAMRDHVLGIRAVTGRGEVIRSGGRVLKNVTGLDLCKLLTGSHGTLGVITEVTLKVLPAPEAVGTVVLPGLDAVAGVAALSAALGSPFGVSATAWLPPEASARIPAVAGFGRSVALARIEDFSTSVTYRTAKLRDALAHNKSAILDDATSREIWRAVRDLVPLAAGTSDAIWRVSVRPSAGPVVLSAVIDAFGASGFLDWGGGLVWIAGPATASAHASVEAAARSAGGTWMLMRAAEPLRAAVDVVPPEPEPLARITRRVKAALDPHAILNPGRMYAGL
ncbi:MAG TPA: glycolate oxidase subunit GlcE [Acetobacteraceae bacterium]|jgi:glycolate oxidase FAD binding subunit|nr:glycolate oxidase subunit GlcE [Acetobacteraceae bacterium]